MFKSFTWRDFVALLGGLISRPSDGLGNDVSFAQICARTGQQAVEYARAVVNAMTGLVDRFGHARIHVA